MVFLRCLTVTIAILSVVIGEFAGGASASAQSIPEILTRHEKEIQDLKNSIEDIRNLLNKASNLPKSTDRGKVSKKCERVWEIIGRQKIYTGKKWSNKYVKFTFFIRKFFDEYPKDSIVLLTEIDELNGKKIYEGSSTKFVWNNCEYFFVIGAQDILATRTDFSIK